MANLIITIISIALVAVAALMGAYYGGAAFLQGQAKANANRIIAAAEQITAAVTVYSTQRGGARGASRAALLNGYLTQIPSLPSDVVIGYDDASAPSMIGFYCSDDEGSTINCTLDTWDRFYIKMYSMEICETITKLVGGQSSDLAVHGDDDFIIGGKFDCFTNGDNDYIFVYRVY